MDSEFKNTTIKTFNIIIVSFQNESPSEKSQDIDSNIASVLMGQCQCSIDVDTTITNGGFQCFPDSPESVTYRAQVHGTSEVVASDFIRIIENWLTTGPSLNVKAQFLNVHTSCQVSITSIDETKCVPSSIETTMFSNTEETTSGGFSIVIIAIIIAVVCVIAIALVIILSIFILCRLRTAKRAPKNM